MAQATRLASADAWAKRPGIDRLRRSLGSQTLRRGARVVDWGGLENRCAFAGTVGSNPTLSAT